MIDIPENLQQILVYIIVAIVSLVIGYLLRRTLASRKLGNAEAQSNQIIQEARKAAETLKKEKLFEAKEEIHIQRANFDKETRERRAEIQRVEKRNLQREEILDERQKEQDKREKELQNQDKRINAQRSALDKQANKIEEELIRIAAMSREEARQQLLDEVDKKLGREKVTRIREMEEQIREEAKKESQKILSNTIHRIASDFVSENTVSVVSLSHETEAVKRGKKYPRS